MGRYWPSTRTAKSYYPCWPTTPRAAPGTRQSWGPGPRRSLSTRPPARCTPPSASATGLTRTSILGESHRCRSTRTAAAARHRTTGSLPFSTCRRTPRRTRRTGAAATTPPTTTLGRATRTSGCRRCRSTHPWAKCSSCTGITPSWRSTSTSRATPSTLRSSTFGRPRKKVEPPTSPSRT